MPDFDFSKVVADLNDVPEQYRPLYNAQADGNGNFVIADAFKPIVNDYVGTSKALKTYTENFKKVTDENGRRRVATGKFEGLVKELGITYDDNDSESAVGALKTFIDDLTAKVANGKDVQINLDKVKKAMQDGHNVELGKKDDENKALRKSLENFMVSQVATAALADAKGSVELLLPIIQKQCKVINENGEFVARVVDEAGDYRTNSAAQPMTVRDLVTEMKANTKYARAFDSEAGNGNGHKPGASKQTQTQSKGRANMTPTDLIAAGLRKGQAGRA